MRRAAAYVLGTIVGTSLLVAAKLGTAVRAPQPARVQRWHPTRMARPTGWPIRY